MSVIKIIIISGIISSLAANSTHQKAASVTKIGDTTEGILVIWVLMHIVLILIYGVLKK